MKLDESLRSIAVLFTLLRYPSCPSEREGRGKVHTCTGTEALYRPYGSYRSGGIVLLFLDHGTRRG